MGCHLIRPQHMSTQLVYGSLQEFQWAATSNALSTCCPPRYSRRISSVSMGCYLKRPQLQHSIRQYSKMWKRFQWAATSNALSYPFSVAFSAVAKIKSFNGLLHQTPSATSLHSWRRRVAPRVSMGCYIKRPQLHCQTTLHQEGYQKFQWAATSNALSYTSRSDSFWAWAKFQWAATSNALSYTNALLSISGGKQKFQWAATSNALSYASMTHRGGFNGLLHQTPSATPMTRRSFNGLLHQTPSATPALMIKAAATSLATSIEGFNGLLHQTPSATLCQGTLKISANLVSMGCYIKRPQLRYC